MTDIKILVSRSEEAKKYELIHVKKEGDAGFDLYTSQRTVVPGDNEFPVDVPTGIKVKLPSNTWALILNRSATPRKMGIEIVPGFIDNGYIGELFACCYNRTHEDIIIEPGTRLAQLALFSMIVPAIEEVEELPSTERGETGFGSTGN